MGPANALERIRPTCAFLRINAIQRASIRRMEEYLAGCDDAWVRNVCGITRKTMIQCYNKYAQRGSALNHPYVAFFYHSNLFALNRI